MNTSARNHSQLRALLEQQPTALFRLVPGQAVRLEVGGRRFYAANAKAAVELASQVKRVDTLRALVALRGGRLTLIEQDSGEAELVLTAGAMTQRFSDVATAESWLQGWQI